MAQSLHMTFEVKGTMTLKDYIVAFMRLSYRTPSTIAFLLIGIFCAIVLLTGIVSLKNDEIGYYCAWVLFTYNILILLANVVVARRHYLLNTDSQYEVFYIFDDEKMGFRVKDAENHHSWESITKCNRLKHFLVLYFSSKNIVIIKIDTLTEKQITFIQSKIKQT